MKTTVAFKYFDKDPNNLSRGNGLYYNRGNGKFTKYKVRSLDKLTLAEKKRLKKLIDSGQLDISKILKNM